ncbi:MAG: ribonucleotide-diphosphate reductase subunit beta [Armatimonadota bacterium]|nr:ribonucleotide-diphosphate reductase subunit beta [Armatimonadota bacterium]MDR7448370.1 ribonucleotide-diphosphate reductase subunit beta [Armatimonadota bacterium]MDR7459771.1 ribonucleotide-diphosphate reductase subunit beta [Armatimonadota bacterium]MDR7479266.1 ribonucleotide-diphosphate reductase subunit beta [Armatimonadota bacterium]MDR7489043.1 ribonucleotide-diphosphate reductase subunit beta [Armatimonadota bacterium]
MRPLVGGNPLEPVQLVPLSYPWAYAHAQQGKRNTWFPEEVPLAEDVRDWETRLSPDEQRAVELLLGFFNPMESLVTHNLVLAIYRHVTAPEARLYLARQIWEEANHTMAFEYVLKTLPVERERVFNAHRNEPAVRAKEEFLVDLSRTMLDPLDLSRVSHRRSFLRNLVGYYIILEGVFFYGGFLFAYTFRRRNLLRGLATIVDWTLKDESLHLSFGIHLIGELLAQDPDLMTPGLGRELLHLILTAVDLERDYNRALLQRPVLGVSAEVLNAYVEYITDRRLEELGLPASFHTPNPAPWMATEVDVPEIVNFFEARNIHYEVAAPRDVEG